MEGTFSLSQKQAEELLKWAGRSGPVVVSQVRDFNHTYRLECGGETFFLKVHTKDWYPAEDAETGFAVWHEVSAIRVLEKHGLAVPEVVLYKTDRKHEVNRPFLLTKQLAGWSLQDVLAQELSQEDVRSILIELGGYMGKMHAIEFPYVGYVVGAGPHGPPDENAWQHPIWSASRRYKNTLKWINEHRNELSAELVDELCEFIEAKQDEMAGEYVQPRFVHGDLNLDPLFIAKQDGRWVISGVIDLEVASAGDCIADFEGVCVGLARQLGNAWPWWESLFGAYGRTPDFDLFRVRLLGWWFPYQEELWPSTGEKAFRHLLKARDWQELFAMPA